MKRNIGASPRSVVGEFFQCNTLKPISRGDYAFLIRCQYLRRKKPMDLLQFPWIPVIEDAAVSHISFEQLLCSPNHYQLSMPRDDMELAALQLLISLAQCIFTPKDRNELVQRAWHPLAQETYWQAVEPYRAWFMLDHPQHPFMQSRGVKAKETTPIQKLFIGLPEGNNHALFNNKGEIVAVCGSCAAIALFNQAFNCPSFGGGFKAKSVHTRLAQLGSPRCRPN
jgi:CRISPR system Cascade subunit CasA